MVAYEVSEEGPARRMYPLGGSHITWPWEFSSCAGVISVSFGPEPRKWAPAQPGSGCGPVVLPLLATRKARRAANASPSPHCRKRLARYIASVGTVSYQGHSSLASLVASHQVSPPLSQLDSLSSFVKVVERFGVARTLGQTAVADILPPSGV